MYLSTIARSLGTTAACADAGKGLLIDCWRQAEQRGLGRLGYALSQEQLSRAATTYQRIMRPNSLAGLRRRRGGLSGWVRSGNRMVWRSTGFGDAILLSDDVNDDFAPSGGLPGTVPGSSSTPIIVPPSPSYVPAPNLVFTPKAPNISTWFPPVVPAVTPQFLLQAAALPNAPAAVKQAAASPAVQAAAAQTAGFDFSWFTGQMISGIPNYALLGAGFVLLLLVSKRRR